jgi:hypothetical protein
MIEDNIFDVRYFMTNRIARKEAVKYGPTEEMILDSF